MLQHNINANKSPIIGLECATAAPQKAWFVGSLNSQCDIRCDH